MKTSNRKTITELLTLYSNPEVLPGYQLRLMCRVSQSESWDLLTPEHTLMGIMAECFVYKTFYLCCVNVLYSTNFIK